MKTYRRNIPAVYLFAFAVVVQFQTSLGDASRSNSKPSGGSNVACPYDVTVLKPNLQFKEDQRDRGRPLSKLFELKKRSDWKPKKAIGIINGPDKSIARIEYQEAVNKPWRPVLKSDADPTPDRPCPIPYGASIRLILKPNAYGTTKIKFVAAYFKPRSSLRSSSHASSKCNYLQPSQYCKKAVEIEVNVTSVPDRPESKKASLPFPPVPEQIDDIHGLGSKVSTLIKVKPYVSDRLINSLKKGVAMRFRKFMAKDEANPKVLMQWLSDRDQEIAANRHRCMEDHDHDELGIAIKCDSPGLNVKTETRIGRWFYKLNKQDWKPLTELAKGNGSSCECAAILNPNDRLKFVPKNNTENWDKMSTRLDFYGRKVKDNRGTKSDCINVTTDEHFSKGTSYMVVSRLGCDGSPDSNAARDKCGVCNGNDDCIGCDGKANSTAKTACGICYGGSTGQSNPLANCRKYCRSNSSYTDTCIKTKCEKINDRDCNGTCKGKASLNKCNVCVLGNTGRPKNSKMDACKICNGDNSTCTDCNGVLNGLNKKDKCGNCLPPNSPKVNKCKKILAVEPSTFKALKEVQIVVEATEVASVKDCSLEHAKTKKKTKLVVKSGGRKLTATVPSTMVAGEYTLACSFDTVVVQYEKSLHAISNNIVCNATQPGYAIIKKKTSATVSGSGFVNVTEVACELRGPYARQPSLRSLSSRQSSSRPPSSRLVSSKLKATFVSSSSVKCDVPALNYRHVDKLCISFSADLSCCTPFRLKSHAPRPVRCAVGKNRKYRNYLFIRFDKAAQTVKKNKGLCCKDILSQSSCEKIFGNNPKNNCKFERKWMGTFTLGLKLANVVSELNISVVHRGFKNRPNQLPTIYDDKMVSIDLQCKVPVPQQLKVKVVVTTVGRGCKYKIQAKVSGGRKVTYLWTATLSSGVTSTSRTTKDLKKLNTFLAAKKNQKRYLKLPRISATLKKIDLKVTVQGQGQGQSRSVTTTLETGIELRVQIRIGVSESKFKFQARSSCGTGGVTFEWSCDLPGLRLGRRRHRRTLFIKKAELRRLSNAYKPFNCTVKATLEKYPSKRSSAITTIQLKRRPLKCSIKDAKGGVIKESDKIHKLKSRRKNSNDDKENSYSWKCEDSRKTPCVDHNGKRISFSDTRDLTVNWTALRKRANETFKFTQTIQNGNNTKECPVYRTVKPGNPPDCKLHKIPIADPSKRAKIVGFVRGWSDKIYYQLRTKDKEGYDVFDITEESILSSGTPDSGVLESKAGRRKFISFIIKPNVLLDNATYFLELVCWDNKSESFAQSEFKTQLRPSTGNLVVDPPQGNASETVFTISNDDDDDSSDDGDDGSGGESQYRYGRIITNKKGKRIRRYFGEATDSDQYEGKLSPGRKKNNHTVEVFREKCNEKQVCSYATKNITVRPRTKSIASDDVKNVTTAANDALDSCDTSTVYREVSVLLQTTRDQESQGNVTKSAKVLSEFKVLIKVVTERVLDCAETAELDDEEEKSTIRSIYVEIVTGGYKFELKFIQSLSKLLLDMDKPQPADDDEQPSRRRKKRAVSEPTPTVHQKSEQEVEESLLLYHGMIDTYDHSVGAMKVKSDFLDHLNDLGRAMCKNLVNNEPAQVAESMSTVLRSEKNSFEHVHTNYSQTGCDQCTDYPHKSMHVLLGQSLKETYDDWDCIDDGCNGACVVSSQMIHDYLINSTDTECNRASDVTYVKLFNPETLVPIAVSNLAEPVTTKVIINDAINITSPNLKCNKWDKTSSSWTTAGVTTLSKDDASRTVKCSANSLGYFAVFDCVNDQTPTIAPPTTTSEFATTQPGNQGSKSASQAGNESNTSSSMNQSSSTSTTSSSENKPTSTTTSSSHDLTTKPTTTTNQHDGSQKVQFSLNASYDDIINSTNKDEFEAKMTEDIASQLGVNKTRIWNLTVMSGSIIVSFVLLPGGNNEPDVQNLTNTLQTLVSSGKLTVTTLDGKTLNVITTSFLKSVAPSSTSTLQPTSNKLIPVQDDGSGMQLEVLIGIIVGACLVVILGIVVALYCRMKAKQKVNDGDDDTPRRSPKGETNHNLEEEHPVDVADVRSSLPGSPIYDNARSSLPDSPIYDNARSSLPGSPIYDNVT